MRFRHRNFFSFWFGYIMILFLFVSLSVIAQLREGWVTAARVFIMFVPIYLLFGYVTLLNTIDLVVDEEGVYRRFLGLTWQSITWDDVRVIKFATILRGGTDKSISIGIYPCNKPRLRLMPSGKIAINELIDNLDRCIELINVQIGKNHILVERVVRGVPTSVKNIDRRI